MDRRVHVVEVPLVGRERAVRVEEPLAEHHDQLVLGEGRVEVGPGDGVERQVPGGEPGVLPRVGHGEDVERVEVPPPGVAALPVGGRGRRLRGVAVEPVAHPVGVHLLAPDQPGARLPEDPHALRVDVVGSDGGVELVSLVVPARHDLVERRPRPLAPGRGGRGRVGPPQPQPQLRRPAAGDRQVVPPRRLRPPPGGVDGAGTGDDVVVDPVLGERRDRVRAEQPPGVGLVVAEQRDGLGPAGGRCGLQAVPAEAGMVDDHGVAVEGQARDVVAPRPPPRVAEPHRGENVDARLVCPVVVQCDPGQQLGRPGLGVGDVHDPEAPVVEHAGVEQLELGVVPGPAGVLVDQPLVRELGLGIVVSPAEQGVAREAVEVPPVLLGVLAVVALRPGQPEHALLEDRVDAVPQRQRQAQVVVDVGQPGHAVLVPPVGAGAGVVVGEVAPGVPVAAVVLAHGAPRPLGQVRAPLVPRVRREQVVLGAAGGRGDAGVLGGGGGRQSLASLAHWSTTGSTRNRCQRHGPSSTYRPSQRSSPRRS